MSHLPTSPGSKSLELLKVAELRDELRQRGLSLKGVKKELFERLEEAVKKEQGIVHDKPGAIQESAHRTIASDGTEEEDATLDETQDKASKTVDFPIACPSGSLPSSCLSNVLPTSPSITDEATPISEVHELSGVSAPDGVPGFNEDREQHSAAGAAIVGTNNDVLFVDNAVCEDGDAMLVVSVVDALEPGKEASGNHETRPEIAASDLKASENVAGASESGFAASVNENAVSDVISVSIDDGSAHVAVDNAVSWNEASGAGCGVQDDKSNLLAEPVVVAVQLSNSETLIEVSLSQTDYKAPMQPTLDSGLPVDEAHEEKGVGDLKTEGLSVASQIVVEDSKLEKPNVDERDAIVKEENPGAKMEPMETDVGLEEKQEVVIGGGKEIFDVKLELMEVEAVLEDKHKLISEGNKEMQIDKENPSQLKNPSKESPSKEVKFEKSSRDYTGVRRGEESSRVLDECRSNTRDYADLKRVEDDSQVCINLKRQDTDLKQQEPAKRMRRWNSGKEGTVDALKPLTTDTVKEIILPENAEGSFVAAQGSTPKPVASLRELTPKLKAEPDSGATRTVPPSIRAPSNSLKIERFVRPFTLKAVKDLLGEFGQCVDFWMDQIKTHCFVTFASVNEAVAARSGLYGRQWPPSVGNFLVTEFVDSNEVKIRSEGLAEKAQPASPTAPLWNAYAPPTPSRVALSAPSFRSNSNTLPSSRFSRETQLPPVPKKDPEPAGLTLEDLFFKTKAKPSIYYLPLTDKQIAEKLSASKNKRASR